MVANLPVWASGFKGLTASPRHTADPEARSVVVVIVVVVVVVIVVPIVLVMLVAAIAIVLMAAFSPRWLAAHSRRYPHPASRQRDRRRGKHTGDPGDATHRPENPIDVNHGPLDENGEQAAIQPRPPFISKGQVHSLRRHVRHPQELPD